MARDVEFDALAHDKTAAGLASVERNFQRTNDKIKSDSEKLGSKIGANLVKGVGRVSTEISSTVADSLAKGGARGAPAILVAVAANAPLIGGLLAAAVIGGAGLGGITGGVLLASRDVRVRAAADDLGHTVMRSLDRNAGVFVRPVLESIEEIKDGFVELDPIIESTLRNSARHVRPLAAAGVDAATDIARGFDTLVDKATPVMSGLNRLIRATGEATGDAFETLAEDADAGASAVDDLTLATVNFIRTATGIVHGLAEFKSGLDQLDDGIDNYRHKLEDALSIGDHAGAQFDITADGLSNMERRANDAAGGMRRVGEGTFGAADGIETAGDAAKDASGDMRSLAEQERDATNAAVGLYASQTSAADAIARSTKIIKENGKGLSLNTEKGRENRDALGDVAAALNRQYDAYVAVNGAGADADAVAASNRASFIRLATSATGSATAANKLADELFGIPTKRDTKINADTAAANASVDGFQGNLAGIDRNVTVTITTRYRGDGSNQNSPSIGGGGGRTFDAGAYWRGFDQSGMGNRSQPPTPIDVANTINVSLDGAPFRSMTAVAVRAERRRADWRSRYGGRH